MYFSYGGESGPRGCNGHRTAGHARGTTLPKKFGTEQHGAVRYIYLEQDNPPIHHMNETYWGLRSNGIEPGKRHAQSKRNDCDFTGDRTRRAAPQNAHKHMSSNCVSFLRVKFATSRCTLAQLISNCCLSGDIAARIRACCTKATIRQVGPHLGPDWGGFASTGRSSLTRHYVVQVRVNHCKKAHNRTIGVRGAWLQATLGMCTVE